MSNRNGLLGDRSCGTMAGALRGPLTREDNQGGA